MLELDPILQAAQDSANHRPIVRIVSASTAADIPFDGNLLNADDVAQGPTSLISHTSGRMAFTYVKDGTLHLVRSDVERTVWTDALLFDDSPVTGTALVELSSGDIGIIFVTLASGTYELHSLVVSPEGEIVVAAASLGTTSNIVEAPALCATSSGCLLVYKYKSGSNYYLYKRTANTEFASWTAAADITLTGLTVTREKNNPALLLAESGRIYLFFDYVESISGSQQQINIYSMYSTDNGSSWSTPAAVTEYAGYSASAIAPAVSQDESGDIVLAFHERRSVITFDHDSSGWDSDCGEDHPWWIHYDAASEKLFLVSAWSTSGTKKLCAVIVIDTTDWTVEKAYTQTGSPGYNGIWVTSSVTIGSTVNAGATHADGQIVAVGSGGAAGSARGILVIDHATEQVREYWFNDNVTYSFTQNVDVQWADSNMEAAAKVQALFLDAARSRLWVAFCRTYSIYTYVQIGYIDLTEAFDPITGMVSFTDFAYLSSSDFDGVAQPLAGMWLRVYPSVDRVVLSGSTELGTYQGWLKVFVLSTGSEFKSYSYTTDVNFPLYGIRYPVLIDNKIYGSFAYTTSYSQGEHRGLAVIDLVSDTITFDRPTFATTDDYVLVDLKPIDTNQRIIMASYTYGAVIYDVAAHTWALYNQDNTPGFPAPYLGSYQMLRVAYDEINNSIFIGGNGSYSSLLVALAEGGIFSFGKYMLGTLSGGDYTFGEIFPLVAASGASDLSVAFDVDSVLWATWTQNDYVTGAALIRWDNNSGAADLTAFIVAGAPVTIDWEIGKPSKATLQLARGDLFDPTNLSSLLAPLLAKGRLVTISLGERVEEVDYWQSQGVRVVTGVSLDFRRGDHPTISVTCEDLSVFWPEMVVTATPAYSDTDLEDVFDSLMSIGQVDAFVTPSTKNMHTIFAQWVDEPFSAIMEALCDHFGCFGHWDPDGQYTWKPIDLSAAVSHVYAGTDKLIDWNMDDRYGSFVNRVTVRCEGHEFLEVLWDEERVGTKNGTVGFWTKDRDFRLWFSEDRTRRCRYCRMDIIQSINDSSPLITLLGASGEEKISDVDPDETWVEVTVSAPDRVVYAFGFAAAVVALGSSAYG